MDFPTDLALPVLSVADTGNYLTKLAKQVPTGGPRDTGYRAGGEKKEGGGKLDGSCARPYLL
jgi:hypothetical protein